MVRECVAAGMMSEGTLTIESMRALPWDEYEAALGEVVRIARERPHG